MPVKFPRRSGGLTPHRTGLAGFELASIDAPTRPSECCRPEEQWRRSAIEFRKSYLFESRSTAKAGPHEMDTHAIIAGFVSLSLRQYLAALRLAAPLVERG